MRGFLPDYELEVPHSLSAALDRLGAGEGWLPIAGGTDVMVFLAAGKLPAGRYLSIWELDELRGIKVADDVVTLGALTTYTDVRAHPVVASEFPMLVDAARLSGAAAIQNRGTLGGNIVNASPAADSPPALLAYDASVRLVCAQGERWVPYREFHTGYKQMDRRDDELLAEIRMPRTSARAGALHYYRKVGTRKAQAISKVGMAAFGQLVSGRVAHMRVAFASVAAVPFVAAQTEIALANNVLDADAIDRAVATLAAELTPIDDVRSTRNYRLQVGCNLLRDFLERLAGVAG